MKPVQEIQVHTAQGPVRKEYDPELECEGCGRKGSYAVKGETRCRIGLCLACLFEQPEFNEISLFDAQRVTMVEQLREWANCLDEHFVPHSGIIAGMREVADDMERG